MNEEIRKVIIENPGLPIKFFVGEDVNQGDYSVIVTEANHVEVKEITFYKDVVYDKEDFVDVLFDDYETGEEVDEIISKTEFEKVIAIYIS